MVHVSTDRSVDLEVDLEENAATGVIVERREVSVDELFDQNGELRLWQDDVGWSGYVLEDGTFYRVNTRFDEDCWLNKFVVGEQAVRDAVAKHIADKHAGGVGQFQRRCSPP